MINPLAGESWTGKWTRGEYSHGQGGLFDNNVATRRIGTFKHQAKHSQSKMTATKLPAMLTFLSSSGSINSAVLPFFQVVLRNEASKAEERAYIWCRSFELGIDRLYIWFHMILWILCIMLYFTSVSYLISVNCAFCQQFGEVCWITHPSQPCFQDRHDDESGDDKSGSEDGKKKRKRPSWEIDPPEFRWFQEITPSWLVSDVFFDLLFFVCIPFATIEVTGAETKREVQKHWTNHWWMMMNDGSFWWIVRNWWIAVIFSWPTKIGCLSFFVPAVGGAEAAVDGNPGVHPWIG